MGHSRNGRVDIGVAAEHNTFGTATVCRSFSAWSCLPMGLAVVVTARAGDDPLGDPRTVAAEGAELGGRQVLAAAQAPAGGDCVWRARSIGWTGAGRSRWSERRLRRLALQVAGEAAGAGPHRQDRPERAQAIEVAVRLGGQHQDLLRG